MENCTGSITRRGFVERSGLGMLGIASLGMSPRSEEPTLEVATFAVDATPSVGAPIAYVSAQTILDPLSARGVILLPRNQLPIVLAAIDWIGISNGSHDAWRTTLADAVGTSPERVAMHSLHQHNAPGWDADADMLLLAHGIKNARVNSTFARDTLRQAAAAAAKARERLTPVTHVGVGKAKVEKFASNRQLLGDDGQILYVRYSSSGSNADMRDAPEGLIDPFVRVISLWNDDQPVAAMTYYATHPQVHYQDGSVTWDTVGIARHLREEETGVFHVHFNGAGGNITAGKYNDGAVENREILARRLASGLAAAWSDTEKTPVDGDSVGWGIRPVALPLPDYLSEETLIQKMKEDPGYGTASDLAWVYRRNSGFQIPITALTLGPARVVHMPGELFIEYQLSAQAMRPDAFVAMAAYGDGAPGYIGTRSAYPLGGYEVSERASDVAPEAEDVLVDAVRELLEVPNGQRIKKPSDFTDEKIRIPRPEPSDN